MPVIIDPLAFAVLRSVSVDSAVAISLFPAGVAEQEFLQSSKKKKEKERRMRVVQFFMLFENLMLQPCLVSQLLLLSEVQRMTTHLAFHRTGKRKANDS